jgi:F-type H+-transporting ATPase subunit b
MTLLESTDFWFLVSFVAFIFVVRKPIGGALAGMLDGRALQIKEQIERGETLRAEAEARLVDIEQRTANVSREVEKIHVEATAGADMLRRQAAARLEATVRRREQQAMAKIGQAEKAAMSELRQQTTDLAIAAVGKILADDLSPAQSDNFIDDGIAELPTKLH